MRDEAWSSMLVVMLLPPAIGLLELSPGRRSSLRRIASRFVMTIEPRYASAPSTTHTKRARNDPPKAVPKLLRVSQATHAGSGEGGGGGGGGGVGGAGGDGDDGGGGGTGGTGTRNGGGGDCADHGTCGQPPFAASSESNGRLHALTSSSRVIPLLRSCVDLRACGPRAASTKHPAQQSDDVLRLAPAPPWQPPKHAGKTRSTES